MIIAISGGLGNQMFQYAYMISQKKRHPECNIYGDLSIIQDYHTHNGFELERVFSDKIHMEYCNEQIHEKLRTKKTFVYRALRKIGLKNAGKPKSLQDKANGFDPYFTSAFDENEYLTGWWQSPKYFCDVEKEIKNTFKFPVLEDKMNVQNMDMIKHTNSVGIHVRRGDYLKYPEYMNLGESQYYNKAIEHIKSQEEGKITWFVFSNDIEWCKQNLPFNDCDSCVYITNNTGVDSYKDMQLMASCKKLIIANSSFSWWAGYLNEYGKIIAPEKYFTDNQRFNNDIYPENWERISV